MSTQKKSGWGSLLGSAVAGLESRLDNILSDEQASAKAKEAAAAAAAAGEAAAQDPAKAAADKQRLQVDQISRSSSRSRPNSRLQDRLAKAVNKGKEGADPRPSSELGSRPQSPALKSAAAAAADAPRTSIDSKVSISEPAAEGASAEKKEEALKSDEAKAQSLSPRPSVEAPKASPSIVSEQPSAAIPTMSIPSSLQPPQTSSPRQSIDSVRSRPSFEISTPAESELNLSKDPDVLQSELSALQKTHEETLREHREELHSHLERIDALQSKLTYLSQQLATSAKAAAADSEATPTDKKLAEKDAQITSLMEEGQKLSKTEMKHMTTIKKMRAKALETDRELTNLKQRLSKAEKSIAEQTERARRAEASEKAAQDKLKVVAKIEKDIELIRSEREEAGLTITELRRQLNDALSRAEDAEKRVQSGALEAEKRAAASLAEDIENLRIEKKLAEDRARRELQTARDESTAQQERAKVTQLELRGEIANLESKLELLRSRSEEVSSSATGDSQAKLLRQIETLQTQYALASENWQGIEGTLTSRVAALEKDRDETAKRESEVQRKAREINSKARRLEDELETISDRSRTLEQDLAAQQASSQKLQTRLEQAEILANEARADLEREKKILEADFQHRLEEEKAKWRLEMQSHAMLPLDANHLRTGSPGASYRRNSPDPLGIHNRRATPRSIVHGGGAEIPLSPMDRMLDEARRPSSSRQRSFPTTSTPSIRSPPPPPDILPPHHHPDTFPFSSSASALNGNTTTTTTSASNTPSLGGGIDFDESSSPHRSAINDMISVSTVGAGPSVQLVERMSALVRRLESEKATSKEEMTRLVSQRDEAREEVVALLREVDALKESVGNVAVLESEMKGLRDRYEGALEMLGEKSERVEELEEDVKDLKKVYRELVETMR
ncbi:hypothetical protein DM02DRAFT_611951 [Periconia macrospinosa]|uniref:TATA element modulatory factor 1 TATA binding domain-containing protein n=1 Tax=Periconia macrospinosa TaxID=97972 RepID=A0A2V1E094_9PLEO|nr:hypothetical protein DM02DRAFT_611951 [Periconia macrospinosa]